MQLQISDYDIIGNDKGRGSIKLKKELNLLDVVCIASGAMISSGLFILPGLAYAKAGPAVVFSYILAGILVIPAMLAKAELVTAMPKAGGDYFFIERSMGSVAGMVGGFVSWLSLSLKSAFALVGIGAIVVLLNPGISEVAIKAIAAGFCIIFTLVNLRSVKLTGKVQISLVLGLVTLLFLYIIGGSFSLQHQRYIPIMPFGLASVFSTAGLVFVSYAGLTKVVSIAEEVKNPGKNIPLGMFLSFLLCLPLYVLTIFITIGLVPPGELKGSLTPISLGAGSIAGTFGAMLMGVAAILAFVSTANAGMLSASRYPMAMSRDKLLPSFFQKVDSKRRTPIFSILFTSIFMLGAIVFLNLENLVKAASTMYIFLLILMNLSLIVMRESKIQNYRPKFRAPLYPWFQIFGILGYGFLIFKMGRIPLLIAGIFIGLALLWYLVYVGIRMERRSALMHIIERITVRDSSGATLPAELKKILIERDNIIEDRFHRLIENCEILDYDSTDRQKHTVKKIFRIVSSIFSRRLGIDEKRLFNLFVERENQSSTVIAHGYAIPHIIIEEKGVFDVLLVRSRKGIIFPDTAQPVHALFVIVSSIDERNFYLRALAAVAQIIQGYHFEKRWMAAKTRQDLRDIFLLGERKR